MDYEKAYKEAIGRANAKIETYNHLGNVSAVKSICEIFPELKENEDERIRKMLIEFFGKGAEYNSSTNGISDKDILAWLEKQNEKRKITRKEICKSYDISDIGEFSDGYHTFNELYYYRMLYNAAFFNMLPKELVHKSKKHHDGEECFGGGWFIVMANLPTGQISNHYELKDWDLFQIPEKETADEWDGHTPQEAADRLHRYLLEKQGEQNPKHFELKAGHWYICHRAFCCRADHLTVKEGERFMCEKDGVVKGFVVKDPEKYFKEVCAPAPIEDEQKPADKVEPKFKVGDTIVEKDIDECDYETIEDIKDGQYIFTDGYSMNITEQEGWQLIKTPANIERKPAWSEKDEKILKNVISSILISRGTCEEDDDIKDMFDDEITWLESIKERMKGE